MTNSVRTGLVVAATVLTLGGSAVAQGLSGDARSRGAGAVGTTPGGVGGSLSGSTRGGVTAPGAGVGVGGQTTGQGSVGVGGSGSGVRGNIGAGGNAGGGVRIGR